MRIEFEMNRQPPVEVDADVVRVVYDHGYLLRTRTLKQSEEHDIRISEAIGANLCGVFSLFNVLRFWRHHVLQRLFWRTLGAGHTKLHNLLFGHPISGRTWLYKAMRHDYIV